MDFILNRNKTVSSTRGHTITFIKDEPVHVPDDMHTDVMAIGAVPVDELPDTEAKLPSEPQGAEREKAIIDAMRQLVLRNKREDFTASGLPDARALKDILGFGIHHKERDAVWIKVQAEMHSDEK